MKKIASVFLIVLTMMIATECAFAKKRYTYITPKAPVITPGLKPCIEKYRQENYTGAMIDLEALLKKEKTNTYAQYYLALCYTKLGYEAEAKTMYAAIVDKNADDSLTYYSRKALACIEDPKSELCVPPQTKADKSPLQKEEDDDITKFIYSGKRIHPAALDNIMKQRMEIKLQQDEYRNRQNEQLGPLSYNNAPTNEEIAFALNTLAKIGINPFSQNYTLSGADLGFNYMNGFNNSLNSYRNNSDIEQMLLYSQLNQNKNNFINYGI